MSAVDRWSRAARRLLGGPPPSRAALDDDFAQFRSVTGPRLVSGPAPRRDPSLDDDPRLVVLLPHLDIDRMSGGPNTVFQVTARLARAGVPVRYVATSGPLRPDRAALLDHVARVTGIVSEPGSIDLVDASNRGATIDLGRGDVLFASWWPTAHLANAGLAHVQATEFLYLIQDFEPGFYAWSTKAALAEATYAMAIRPIINEPFLERFLRDARVGRFADAAWPRHTFMPAVDRTVFAPLRATRPVGAPRRLLFYGRPRNPRNLFEIGLRALRVAASEGVFDGSTWEFLAIGQPVPDLPISDRHVLRAEPWRSYREYGALLGSSDLLLSLMLSPHTSYPPLEMAAAGGLVVTNEYGPKTAAALASISPSIRATAPAVEPLVGALRAAVAEIERPDRDTSLGALRLDLPATWDESLADVTPALVNAVRDLRGGG